jgi:F-type H+-transporting ATPase subunit delta
MAELSICWMMQSRGEHAAYITVASALSDGQIADIEVALAAASGKKIKAIVSVDDEILGGIVVRIGSKMLDASVAYQIDKFAELSRKAVMNLN